MYKNPTSSAGFPRGNSYRYIYIYIYIYIYYIHIYILYIICNIMCIYIYIYFPGNRATKRRESTVNQLLIAIVIHR